MGWQDSPLLDEEAPRWALSPLVDEPPSAPAPEDEELWNKMMADSRRETARGNPQWKQPTIQEPERPSLLTSLRQGVREALPPSTGMLDSMSRATLPVPIDEAAAAEKARRMGMTPAEMARQQRKDTLAGITQEWRQRDQTEAEARESVFRKVANEASKGRLTAGSEKEAKQAWESAYPDEPWTEGHQESYDRWLRSYSEARRLLGDDIDARTEAMTVAKHTPDPADRAALLKAIEDTAQETGRYAKMTLPKRIGTKLGRGLKGMAEDVLQLTPEGMDPDDYSFYRAILGTREQADPVVRKSDPFYKRWTLEAAEQAFPMAAMVAGGSLAGGAAKTLGAGAKAVRAAQTVGITGTMFPQSYAGNMAAMADAGVDAKYAKPISVAAAVVEGAIESILPNPFKVKNPGVVAGAKQAVLNYLKGAASNYGTEVSEEVLQGLSNGAAKVAATWLDENAPDLPITQPIEEAITQGVQAAGPLLVLMGPGSAVGAARTSQEAIRRANQAAIADAAGKKFGQPLSQHVLEVKRRLGRAVNQRENETVYANGGAQVGPQVGEEEGRPTAPDEGRQGVPSGGYGVQEPVAATDTVSAAEPVREPWQMTASEYSKYYQDNYATEQRRVGNFPRLAHKNEVRMAKEAGKPVPPEVQAEFRDLFPTVAPTAPTPAPAASPAETTYSTPQPSPTQETAPGAVPVPVSDTVSETGAEPALPEPQAAGVPSTDTVSVPEPAPKRLGKKIQYVGPRGGVTKPKFKVGDVVASSADPESRGVVEAITPKLHSVGPKGELYTPEYTVRWEQNQYAEAGKTTPMLEASLTAQPKRKLGKAEAAREPWQMTVEEWVRWADPAVTVTPEFHRTIIEEAANAGKSIPPAVQAQYPDLFPQAPEPIPETAPIPSQESSLRSETGAGSVKGLPGMEDIAAEAEEREKADLQWRPYRERLEAVGGEEFAEAHRKPLRGLVKKILRAVSEFGDAQDVMSDFSQEENLPAKPKHIGKKAPEYEYDSILDDIFEEAMKQASAQLDQVGSYKTGAKVAVDTYRGGMATQDVGTIQRFELDDSGVPQAVLKLEDGFDSERTYPVSELVEPEKEAPQEEVVEAKSLQKGDKVEWDHAEAEVAIPDLGAAGWTKNVARIRYTTGPKTGQTQDVEAAWLRVLRPEETVAGKAAAEKARADAEKAAKDQEVYDKLVADVVPIAREMKKRGANLNPPTKKAKKELLDTIALGTEIRNEEILQKAIDQVAAETEAPVPAPVEARETAPVAEPTAKPTQSELGKWTRPRSTPQKGTPDRARIDSAVEAAEKEDEASRQALSKIETELDKTGRATKKYAQLDKRRDKAVDARQESRQRYEVAREAWWQARLEDAAEQTENKPLAIAARSHLEGNKGDGGRAAYDQLRTVLTELAEEAKSEQSDGAGKLSEANDKTAVDRAIATVASDLMGNPLMGESVKERLTGTIRRMRIEEYKRRGEFDIAELNLPGSDDRLYVDKVRSTYDFDVVDKAVREAKGRKVQIEKEKKQNEVAQSEKSVANAKALQPLATKGASVKQGWGGTIAVDDPGFLSDGYAIVSVSKLSKKDADLIRKSEHPGHTPVKSFVDRFWKPIIEKKVADATFLGAMDNGPGRDLKGDVAYFTDGSNLYAFDKQRLAYLTRVTAPDAWEIHEWTGTNALVGYRDGSPVFALLERAPGLQIHLATAQERKLQIESEAPKKSLGHRTVAAPPAPVTATVSVPPKLRLEATTRKLGRKTLSRADVAAAFPGAKITPAANGWHVEIGDSYLTVERVQGVTLDWEEVEKHVGHPISEETRQKIGVAGSFSITMPDGTQHRGLGLVRLVEGMADDATLRHEALHLARAAGLFGDSEWQALVDAHAKGITDPAQQEERIAQAREAMTDIPSVWQRITAWLRRLLSKLGITEYQARDIHFLMNEAGFWARPGQQPSPLQGTRYSLRARPDLANPAIDQPARDLVDEVDEQRNQAGKPERKADAEVEAEAARRLEARYETERDTLLERGRSGQMLSDVDTVIAKKIVNREATDAIQSGDQKRLSDAMALIESYRNTGTEQGRAFRQRIDPVESPAERMARALSEALLTPPTKMRERRNKLRREGKTEAADKINEDWAKKFQGLKEKLKALGIDIDNLNELGYSRNKAAKVLAVIGAAKSSFADKMYEYWRNAILSAPATAAANFLGYGHAVWRASAQRLMEATVNVAMRRPEGAQFGEFKYVLAGVLPGMSRAARNFLTTWKTEMPTLEAELAREGQWRIEDPNVAIAGQWGRAVRTPQRGLAAVDDFCKSLFVEMEAGAQAYRIALAEGKTGDALSNRIAELVDNIESEAWDFAYDSTLIGAFQQKGGETVQVIKKNLLSWRRDMRGVRYLIPFVTTVVNIFGSAVQMSPLGTVGVGVKMYQNYRNGDHVLKDTSPLVAQQVLAWALVLALMGSNDPDDPWITGSDTGTGAEKEVEYRTRPPMSVKIGKHWYSYARLEPFATAVGTTVDVVKLIQNNDPANIANPLNSIVKQMVDKPFLTGIGDFYEAMQAKGFDKITAWASNFAVSWVPNIVRSGFREADETYMQRGVWGRGREWKLRTIKRLLQKTELPLTEEYPIYDVWGRPAMRSESPVGTDWLYRVLVPVRTQPADMFVADRLILNYNNQNPDDETLPVAPAKYYQKDGKTVYMTDGQYADYCRLSGQAARYALTTQSPVKLDPEHPTLNAVNWIKDVSSEARGLVRDALKKKWSGEMVDIDVNKMAYQAYRNVWQRTRTLKKRPGETPEHFSERRAETLPWIKKVRSDIGV